ncbi:MAG: 30S ribosomal protein S15, partial [Nanopusillaceae archaeon]
LKEEKGIDIRQITNKKLTRYMKEDLNIKMDIPEELLYLLKKVNRMLKHLETNKKDMVTKKALEETESYIKSLIKYYKKKRLLPKSFEYTRDLAKMYGYT